jgi:predicted O-linked N-acetylglucosamine transferase (SPINDLY family)
VYPNCKWHHVKDLSDTGLYDLIRSHKVDILFDLSAQTGDNRLNTFVLKPAPIQITYCGYPNSSGILSMDYRLTDKNCDGEESEKYYVEKLVYLKDVFLCYTSTSDVNNLPLTTPPCTKNNWITFGCFNRYNKINDMVVGVWEKLLKRIPNARFVIKTKEFGTKKVLDKFINCFKDKSVLERVQILDYADMYDEHLLDYNKMDIALDTFPYSGTTTSCEALLMGVPILTLYDNVRHYHSQNVTTSFMRNCGMEHFVAYSQEEYIEKAVEFSKNLNALSNIKQDVRHRFLTSPMSKHKEFAQNFEKTLLDIYKNHAW